MLNDPLSEARGLIRAFLSVPGRLGDGQLRQQAREFLARPLPAPVRFHMPPDIRGHSDGWFYPDAPVTVAAAPRWQPPAAREDTTTPKE